MALRTYCGSKMFIGFQKSLFGLRRVYVAHQMLFTQFTSGGGLIDMQRVILLRGSLWPIHAAYCGSKEFIGFQKSSLGLRTVLVLLLRYAHQNDI